MPLLDVDPLTGAVDHMQYDHNTKGLTITRARNIDATLDRNAWAFNNADKTWKGKDLWHVASVPEEIVWTWLLEFNAVRPQDERIQSPFVRNKDWEDFQWKRLNSSGYHKLRVAPVHV